MAVPDWIARLWPWRAYRHRDGWPDITPPTVPPTGPPTFEDGPRPDASNGPDKP